MATTPITEHHFDGIDPLNYDDVGIHKKIGLMGPSKLFHIGHVTGKAVVDKHCIYSVPNEELNVS